MSFSRRQLLVGAAALAAFSRLPQALAQARGRGALHGARTAFPLGVASGEVTSQSAVLWTRYLGERPLEAAVFAEADAIVGTGSAASAPLWHGHPTVAPGGFVHLPVASLEPSRRYAYVFREQGGEAIVGRFRAADVEGTQRPFVFTASACSRNGRSFRTLQGLHADIDADLHVLLGDTVYADGSLTVDEFRAKWAENLSRPEYRALRASRPVIAAWDDHEVSNDWSGPNLGPMRTSAGIEAFFEHSPLHRIPSAPNRLWRSHRFGDTVEFFVLDGRSERTPQRRRDDDGEYLSRLQFEWLKQSLEASTARFKILVNSVPIGEFPGPFQPFTRDRWMGYAAQREALLRFLERADLRGVFVLSGDFHMASLGKVSPRGPGSSLWEVLVGAVATRSRNPFTVACRAPQYAFASAEEHTARVQLEPRTGEVTIRWTAAHGRVLAQRRFVV